MGHTIYIYLYMYGRIGRYLSGFDSGISGYGRIEDDMCMVTVIGMSGIQLRSYDIGRSRGRYMRNQTR